MRRSAHLGLLTAMLLTFFVASDAATAQTPASQPISDDQWVSLGRTGIEVRALAVAPDWPAGRFIYVVGHDTSQPRDPNTPTPRIARRTFDGGSTWEELPAPPRSFERLTLTTSARIGRVLFGFPEPIGDLGRDALYRSTDDGRSWLPVLPLIGRDNPSLIVSPHFAADDLAFVLTGDQFFRSRDGGQTWERLDPRLGWRVHQIVFSPDFANDQTVFAAVSVGSFTWILPQAGEAQPFDAALHGDGDVLRSIDGGDTWTPSSNGLELDGAPYRHVEALAISPTFVQDRTLFAYAWGTAAPPGYTSTNPPVRPALFVSRDGGATWQYLWEPFPPDRWRPNLWSLEYHAYNGSIILSPQFATNGIGVMAIHTRGVSPHNGYCELFRTADYGASWSLATPEPPASGAPYSCRGLSLSGSGGQILYWHGTADGSTWWERSLSGGASRDPGFSIRHGAIPGEGAVAVADDGSFIYGSRESSPGRNDYGVWILPAGSNTSEPPSP